ncbi:hypothetical protein IQ06DRAFT_335659 [Phaeosphaeriaceae sp. SRC1lsM3a]|nr:hypothetical protein IQ06DRAFT_335659 [Stagonospora sp. SRC1lsM3a]
MAGFAEQNAAHAQHLTATNTSREPSSRPSLPNGPCNYRDAASGQCGCDQFWDKFSAELHDQSTEHRPTSDRSTWCVCGHHACFHLKASRTPTAAPQFQLYQAKYGEGHQTLPGAQCDANHVAGATAIVEAQDTHNKAQATESGHYKLLHSGIGRHISQPDAVQLNETRRIEQGRDAPSQASTSGLPSIPSVCMLSRDQRSGADLGARHDANQSHHTVTGLGLSMMHIEGNGALTQQQPPSPTVADENSVARVLQQSFSEPEIASTRANSIAAAPDRVCSPPRGLLDQIVEFNRNLQLDTGGDTIPNTYNPNDYIQSATEVGTPSAANTPDLGVADQAVQEGKNLIDTLSRLTSNMQQSNGSPSRRQGATSAPGTQQWLTNSPAVPQEQLQQVIRAASPQALQKLISYLAPLHNLLNSIPNVANTMRDLSSRIDVLESGSFNYVQPEDFNQTLSLYDDRIVDLEHRMNDHDKHHQIIEAEDSTTSSRRRINILTDSFDSNHSLQSTTSSALILAAMDRKDTETELGNIKDRLDVLESVALPTTYQPWDVEVVLIPWGRDLRGIWFSPDEPMHDMSRTTTQDTEEWTQVRSSRHGRTHATLRDTDSSPYRGPSTMINEAIISDNESGWSSQAISNWATGSADDWLFPKACGTNNLVFKRLQSRGFIRNVTLRNASARDLQAALSHAFSDLLEHLSYTNQDDDAVITAHPGLRASFIPLRKVHKESKLRFLSPAEMTSSALWSAQFLASGIMMRVSGGKKRLYVTQREAYIQHSDDLGSTWTWQELRQLPRIQPDQDLQMEGNDEHCQPAVPEADAKETCWQYIEAYDAPPASLHSSFGSHQSVELSVRPAHNDWRRSITPSSILKNKMPQPLSPQSEFHSRPAQFRQRTTSASIVEPLTAGSSKRRFNSSPIKQSSAPLLTDTLRTPSVSVSRLKRRRTANPSSLHQERSDLAEAHLTIWNPTPRRSREPPSPFITQPPLPRTNSDVASRPSQRSVALVGKSTPFAYATPHSGLVATGYNNGGDTEPDDDEDDHDGNSDDGEQSWRGVTDGEDEAASSSSSSSADPEDGIHGASFSGDDSGFGSESGANHDDDDEQSEFDVDRNPRHNTTTDDDDEEEGDVFDTLLGVLQH